MEPKWGLVGPTFQKKCENEKVRLDCAGAYGLHMSPSLKAPDATKKSQKKQMCFKYAIFSSKIRKCLKNDLPTVSKWLREFRGWRLLGHLWRHYSKHVLKRAPKVIPRLLKCLQKGSQSAESESQVLENSRKWHRFESWPGGLRKALTITNISGNNSLYCPFVGPPRGGCCLSKKASTGQGNNME